MSHTWWLPRLREGNFGGGLPEQVKDYSETFYVRSRGAMEGIVYYIAWKGTNKEVEGAGEYKCWTNAKNALAENWKRFLDEEFERQFLNAEKEDKD